MSYLLILSWLLLISTTSETLNNKETALISLAQNLAVKHFIILTDASNLYGKNNFSRFIKFLSQLNVFVQQLPFQELNLNVEFDTVKRYKRKTIAFLSESTASHHLPTLFNEYNETLLSHYSWVIFNPNKTVFKQMYIPYDCQFLVLESQNETNFNIAEVYNILKYSRRPMVANFGFWNQNSALNVFSSDFYQRRFDLNYSLFPVHTSYYPSPCYHKGLCAYEEIVTDMGKIMNFYPQHMTYKAIQKYWDSNTAVFYEFYVHLYVFNTKFLSQTLGPIWETPAFLHIKYVNSYMHGEISPHIRPFRPELWYTILISIIASTICMTGIGCLIVIKKLHKIIFTDFTFISLESFMNQCGSVIPNIKSYRLATIITRAGPALIIPLYSAVVISFVTINIVKLPFLDLEGFISDGSFKMAYLKDTVMEYYFNEAKYPVLKTVQEKHLYDLDDMPEDVEEAVDKICENSKFVFVYFNNDVFSRRPNCDVLQIPKPIYVTYDVFWLRPNSSYKSIFNRVLKSFRSSGVLQRMEKIVYGKKPTYSQHTKQDPVEFGSMIPLLKVTGALYLFSLILLILEKIIYKNNINIKSCF